MWSIVKVNSALLRNEKDGYLYTDMLNLIVIELMHEELATEEDIACGIDKWVRPP
jgi:hypothetical protein